MTREILERLLTDRALGTLEPDVAALLEAHLAADPAAAALAARTQATIALAQRALGEKEAGRLPNFPRAELARRAGRLRRWRIARTALAAAAVLLVGVGVGRWMSAEGGGVVPQRSAAPPVVANAPPDRAGLKAEAGESVLRKTMIEWQRRADRVATPRWNWISPAKLPRVGGAS